MLLAPADLLCWYILGQAPPTMLIYANCTTTVTTAQANTASLLATHACRACRPTPCPLCLLNTIRILLTHPTRCPCPCFLGHFHFLMAPFSLGAPHKALNTSHQSVSWTPCLPPVPVFQMLVAQGSVLLLALLSCQVISVSYCQDAHTSQFSVSSQLFFLL